MKIRLESLTLENYKSLELRLHSSSMTRQRFPERTKRENPLWKMPMWRF